MRSSNGLRKKSALGDRLSLVTTGSCSLSSFRVSPASDAEVAHSSRQLLTTKKNTGIFEVVKAPSAKLL